MKILSSYKKIAKELIKEAAWDRKFGEPLPTLSSVMNEAEVDDDKMIKYKKKDGEQGEMKASSAKKMEKDHPAKIAYDKMKGDDDSGEKEKGKDLGAGDFERPGTEKPSGDKPSGEPEDGGELGKDEFGNVTGTAEQWKSGEHDEAAAAEYEDYPAGIEYDMAQAQRDDKQNERWYKDGDISQEKYEEKHAEAAAAMEKVLAAKRHIEKQKGGEEPSGDDFLVPGAGDPGDVGIGELPDRSGEKTKKIDKQPGRETLKKLSRKDLAKWKVAGFDDDGNYLGNEDYEYDPYEPPEIGDIGDMDKTELKRSFFDLQHHKMEMEQQYEEADDGDDDELKKESEENMKAAVVNQNRILQALNPTRKTGSGFVGTREPGRGGSGMYDSININGQKYKPITESKEPTTSTVHPFKKTYKRIGGK